MPQSLEDSKKQEGNFLPISEREERIGKLIVDAAYTVHKNLGLGLLERVYEICFVTN